MKSQPQSKILLRSMMDLKGDSLVDVLTFCLIVVDHPHLGQNCLWFHQGEHRDSITHKVVNHHHLGTICLLLHQGGDQDSMKRQCLILSWSSLVSSWMIIGKWPPKHAISLIVGVLGEHNLRPQQFLPHNNFFSFFFHSHQLNENMFAR